MHRNLDDSLRVSFLSNMDALAIKDTEDTDREGTGKMSFIRNLDI